MTTIWWQYGPLPPVPTGSRFIPLRRGRGDYQFHILAERCPEAACCYLQCENNLGVPSPCTVDADCPGAASVQKCEEGRCICAIDADCGGGGRTCEPACDMKNVLDCDASLGTYLGPPNVDTAALCIAGLCDNGSCCLTGGFCNDTEVDNVSPISKDDCDTLSGKYHGGTLCFGGTCSGGTRDGLSCNDDTLCPNGTCVGTPTQLAQRTCPICEINDDALPGGSGSGK